MGDGDVSDPTDRAPSSDHTHPLSPSASAAAHVPRRLTRPRVACVQFDPTPGNGGLAPASPSANAARVRELLTEAGLLTEGAAKPHTPAVAATSDDAAPTASAAKLDLLVLPEMALSGYKFSDEAHIAPHLESLHGDGAEGGPTLALARALAHELGCYVLAGFPEDATRTASESTSAWAQAMSAPHDARTHEHTPQDLRPMRPSACCTTRRCSSIGRARCAPSSASTSCTRTISVGLEKVSAAVFAIGITPAERLGR